MVNNQQCRTVTEEKCSTVNEKQCSTVVDQQCSTTYRTVKDQECWTEPEEKCHITYQMVCDDSQMKKSRTSGQSHRWKRSPLFFNLFKGKSKSSGRSLNKRYRPSSQQPRKAQNCRKMPKKVCKSVPRTQC